MFIDPFNIHTMYVLLYIESKHDLFFKIIPSLNIIIEFLLNSMQFWNCFSISMVQNCFILES